MTTLKEIRDQVIEDLDLDEETFIEETDLNRWINSAVKRAEREIHSFADSYFLSYAEIPILAGTNKYNYPSDIYANKIKKIIYTDGNETHVVSKVRKLEDATADNIYINDTAGTLQWMPVNIASEGRKIQLFPTIARTGTLLVWYIRNAKILVNDSDICDIDEFSDFIVQATKTQAYLKDGDMRADDSKNLEEQYKIDMINTLEDMIVDDEDDKLYVDTSFYKESVGG